MIEEEVGKKKQNEEEPVMKLYRSSKGSKLQGASRNQDFGFRHDTPLTFDSSGHQDQPLTRKTQQE